MVSVRLMVCALCLVAAGRCDSNLDGVSTPDGNTENTASETSTETTTTQLSTDAGSITPIIVPENAYCYRLRERDPIFEDPSQDKIITDDSSTPKPTATEETTTTATDENTETLITEHACDLNPCQNGGTCVNGSTSFHCKCPGGYVGLRCEVEDLCDGLDGDNCKDGACVFSQDGSQRKCICFQDKFWDSSRKVCRVKDPPCFPNPCQNGGTCSEQDESMPCNCAKNFEGKYCSIHNKCGQCERGKCVLDEKMATKYCQCPKGMYWNEKNGDCEEPEPPCIPEPCLNNGKCVPLPDDHFNCSCADEFSGMTCEVTDRCGEDCGGHGKCVLSNNKTLRTCHCDEGYYLEESTHACQKEVKPCLPNPCLHSGICTPDADQGFNCTCSVGYDGPTCAVRSKCEMDGGKAFCALANCTDVQELDTYVCECEHGKYFDYSKRICTDLNRCAMVECKDAETCVDGACECKEHWIMDNSTGTCKPDICSTHPCPSPDLICEEGLDSYDYSCSCKEGYSFNGHHCEEASCHFPSLNHCGQQCTTSEDGGYDCSCEDDFQLREDNKTCSYIGNTTCTNDTCSPGYCVSKVGEEYCICPSGFMEDNRRCVDACSADHLPDDLCPLDQCETTPGQGYRCKCDGKYTQADDHVTCSVRSVCKKDEVGWVACNARNSLCVPDWEEESGFKCHCSEEFVEDDKGNCVDICSIEENQLHCSALGGTCGVDLEGKMKCKCPPYFQKNQDGYCTKAADASLLITLPLDFSTYQKKADRKQRSLEESVDYRKIEKDVILAVQQLFYEFTEANILSCISKTDFLLCKVELQFRSKVPQTDLKRMQSEKICIEGDSVQCLLPPSLVLVADKIEETVVVHPTDPCDKDIQNEVCGSETTCTSAPGSRSFNCSCKTGFAVRRRLYPFGDAHSVVEECRDIDECEEDDPCPQHSNCRNTIGSYVCTCNPGFRSLKEEEEEQCVEICSPNPCVHGDCSTNGDHNFDCKCEAGYRGALCDLEDKHFKAARINTVIVGVVLGGVLLITVILSVACYSKLKKKKEFDDTNVYYNSSEMTERRQAGVVNNAFQRE